MPNPTGATYPTTLDNTTTLGDVADNVDTIRDEDHNEPQEAIIALETKVGINLSGVTTSQDYLIRQLEAGPNPIVNPGFEINTRGVSSSTTDGAKPFDCWVMSLTTSSATVTPETTIIDSGSGQSAKIVYTHSGAGFCYLTQKIENWAAYKGQQVTFAFRARSSVAATVVPFIHDGVATHVGGYNAGTGAFETVSVTGTISASATTLILYVALPAASCTAYIDNCTFGIGPSIVPYRPRSKAIQIEECRRFIEVHGGVNAGYPYIDEYGLASSIARMVISFVTAKAGVPTMTNAGTWNNSNHGSARPVMPGGTKYGYTGYVAPTITARTVSAPDSSDDIITAEYNL